MIKKGFPPKPLEISSDNMAKSISDMGIKNKDALIIEENQSKIIVAPPIPQISHKEDLS